MRILAIDPGTRHLGYVGITCEGDVLVAGALTLPKSLRADRDLSAVVAWYSEQLHPAWALDWDEVYVEAMYTGGKGDPADLLHIQAVGAFLAGQCGADRAFWMTPQQWKGCTPKAVQHAQMQEWMQGQGAVGKYSYWGSFQMALARTGTDARDFEHAYDAMGIALAATGLCGNKLAIAAWRALRAKSPLHTELPRLQPLAKPARPRTAKPAFVKRALTRASKKK